VGGIDDMIADRKFIHALGHGKPFFTVRAPLMMRRAMRRDHRA